MDKLRKGAWVNVHFTAQLERDVEPDDVSIIVNLPTRTPGLNYMYNVPVAGLSLAFDADAAEDKRQKAGGS